MANPPITIGPFTNVPAPGSPIKSDWPQQLTSYAVATDTEVRTFLGAAAYNTGQSIGPGGSAIMSMPTTVYDSGGFRPVGDSTKFVVPAGRGGSYNVMAYVGCTGPTSVVNRFLIDAGTYTDTLWSYVPAYYQRVAAAFPVVLSPGDEVKLTMLNMEPTGQFWVGRLWLNRVGP